MLWRRVISSSKRRWNLRRFSSALRNTLLEDEGDWSYVSEWWGTGSVDDGHTILRSTSDKGNGVVSVVAHPCSKPHVVQWRAMEKWLQQRYLEIHPEGEQGGNFEVLGYQWRVLRFNDFTRQSTVKIMAACEKSNPSHVCIMQQPHILAVPYLKSMVSSGLATLVSCNYDLVNAVLGKKPMHVLCIGHGGGSLPLFLASKIRGAVVHIVEIDSLVISASVKAMGFPSFSMMKQFGERAFTHPGPIDEVFWKGTHERLFLHESDAEQFILNTTNIYDLVFIDAYDGDDIFPHKLWDPKEPFLEALKRRLHPEHGTVVVNLHSDADITGSNGSPDSFHQLLPMGKYISQVCRAYKDVLVGGQSGFDKEDVGVGFILSVPLLCNYSLVVSRGFELGCRTLERDSVFRTLISKSHEVEDVLNLPFSCFQYLRRGFALID